MRAVALMLAVGCGSSPKPAPIEHQSAEIDMVYGRVIDWSDRPVPDARVTAYFQQAPHGETTTDKDGHFKLSIPVGSELSAYKGDMLGHATVAGGFVTIRMIQGPM